jgi:hypothetical protein
MEAGNADALLNMSGSQLDEVGNTEMLNWAVMYGAIGALPGELIDYIPTWHHGLGMMRFLPQRARKQAPMQVEEQFGGFHFRNEGYQFYKHPPAEAYALNKLLFESRHSERLRQRIVDEFDAVADEYGLQGQQRQAARAMLDVAKGPLVSDHVKPLADAGCHPLQALMSLHVIYSTTHKGRHAAVAGGKH